MSIDFVARVSRRPICREFLRRLHEVAERLAGFAPPPMRVSWDPEGREDLTWEEDIGVEGPLIFLKMGPLEGGVSMAAMVYSKGELGVSDALEGTWVSASIGGLREPWQFVAALAAVVAVSELGGGQVVDEAGFWSAGESWDPEEVLKKFSATTASADFESGAKGLMERVLSARES